MQVRRVVTGDLDGRAIAVSDEQVDPITIALMPGNEFHRIGHTTSGHAEGHG
jgi:hypothetical protein